MSDDITPYGFRWGAALVQRCAEYRGTKVVTVTTPTRQVELRVSPTGRSIRVWLDGKELS